MSERVDWEVVFQTESQVEAEIIKGLLATGNIPVVVQPKGLKSMATIFGHSVGGQLLLKVPPDQADLARQLIAADFEPPEVPTDG